MPKTISIELSELGINRAIKELEDYQKWVENKTRELTQRLAQLGGTVAIINFSRAIYNGDNDVVVTVEAKDNGYVVNASGESVCFIEFGTGIGAVHPKGPENGFTPGSWSENDKKQFTQKGYWYFNKQRMTGSTPGKGMYEASKQMREQLLQIAKEVFNSD